MLARGCSSNGVHAVSESRLILYACQACGAVSTLNFRDKHCRVCNTAMAVDQIIIDAYEIQILEAPHAEENE